MGKAVKRLSEATKALRQIDPAASVLRSDYYPALLAYQHRDLQLQKEKAYQQELQKTIKLGYYETLRFIVEHEVDRFDPQLKLAYDSAAREVARNIDQVLYDPASSSLDEPFYQNARAFVDHALRSRLDEILHTTSTSEQARLDSRFKITKWHQWIWLFPLVFLGHLVHESGHYFRSAISMHGFMPQSIKVLADPHVTVSEIEDQAPKIDLVKRAAYYRTAQSTARFGFVVNFIASAIALVVWGYFFQDLSPMGGFTAYFGLSNLIVGIGNAWSDSKDRDQARYFGAQASLAENLLENGFKQASHWR